MFCGSLLLPHTLEFLCGRNFVRLTIDSRFRKPFDQIIDALVRTAEGSWASGATQFKYVRVKKSPRALLESSQEVIRNIPIIGPGNLNGLRARSICR
jgi:hypothetical protein